MDYAALLAALESGQLGRYVVDFPSVDPSGVEKVSAIPRLAPRVRGNRTSMAAEQLRDYLEFGSIYNSVNMPEVALAIWRERVRTFQ